MKMYLVRHSYTEINEQKRIQGRIDIPLSENGRIHAKEVFNKIPFSFDYMVTSPLIRASETAQIIGLNTHYQKPYITVPQFIERDFGLLDYELVESSVPYVSREKTIEGYESDEALMKRVRHGLDILHSHYGNQTLLVVSHAHVMKAILKFALKESMHFSHTKILHQEYYCVEYDGNQITVIEHAYLK